MTVDPGALLRIAFALRIAVAAATLLAWKRSSLSRVVAFTGSTAASLLTLGAAAAVLRAGSPGTGVLLVHRASGFALTFALDGLSAWFLLVLGTLSIPVAVYSVGYLASPHWARRAAFVGAFFNVLLGSVELVFVAGDALTLLFAWELMTLATAALVATEHETADARRAAYLYLVMSHVGTGCLIAGFLVLASASGSLSFSTLLTGVVPPGAERTRALRAVLRRLRREGGRHSAAHLASGGAPGGSHEHFRLHVRRAPQGRHLWNRARVRVRPRRAEPLVGRGRPRPRWRVGGPGRSLRADAARPQAAARLSQHREHRHHPAGRRGRHDGARLRAQRPGVDRVRGRPVSRVEPRRLQGPPVPRGGQRGDGHRHAADRTARRAAPADAVDRPLLPHRRDGHFRIASAERLRQRVADLPGVPLRIQSLHRTARPPAVPDRRRAAGADDGAGRRLFRQGLRDQFPRPAAQPRRR